MYIEFVNNKCAGNPIHLAHQGLADVKAAMGQIFPGYAVFSSFLTQLDAQTPENSHCAKVNAVHF